MEIQFKRFPEEKQEQIRQFVAYAQMCGLTGKDIRSIGDKLDRIRKSNERKQNMEIIKGFECLPVGLDIKQKGRNLEQCLDSRFKLKTARGVYTFTSHYSTYDIQSATTKTSVRYRIDAYDHELGANIGWARRQRYVVLLDISQGKLKLDF